MQLKYGNTAFDANAIGVTQEHRVAWNQGGQAYELEKVFRCEGFIYGDTQSAITLAMSALETAVAIQNQTLVLLQDDLANSATILSPTNSITGVQSRVLGYPRYQGAEYATYRSITLEFRACYPVANSSLLLLDWQETISGSGGGPVYRMRPNLNVAPSRWLVWPQYPAKLIQEGFAVGYRSYPTPPGPLFPNALMENPNIKKASPKRRGNGYSDYRIDWRYEMQDVSLPSAAVPNVWA